MKRNLRLWTIIDNRDDSEPSSTASMKISRLHVIYVAYIMTYVTYILCNLDRLPLRLITYTRYPVVSRMEVVSFLFFSHWVMIPKLAGWRVNNHYISHRSTTSLGLISITNMSWWNWPGIEQLWCWRSSEVVPPSVEPTISWFARPSSADIGNNILPIASSGCSAIAHPEYV